MIGLMTYSTRELTDFISVAISSSLLKTIMTISRQRRLVIVIIFRNCLFKWLG